MIDNDEFRITGEYYVKSNNNIGLSWMIDKDGYEEIAEEAGACHMKGKNNNELKLVKDFITKINNGTINNKNKAGNEFRKFKQKVTNDILRQDLIKYLERYLFGEDIEPEEEYEESIAERVKTRRKNKETDRDTQRTFAPQDSSINLHDFTYGENYDELENVEVVLVHCNFVNNSYQQHSRVLFTFVPNKQYGQLISISPNSLIYLKTINTEFSEIEIWFTDQNNNALEIEDNVNISLIINTS